MLLSILLHQLRNVMQLLQNRLTKWADDCLKSKTDIVEFLVNKFLEDEKIQNEFKKEYCDNEH